MSNGEMLSTIKELIENGDPFTAKQFQVMVLSGVVEVGDEIKKVRDDLNKVDKSAQSRVCEKVLQAEKNIEKLEGKSNRNDSIVSVGVIISTVIGAIFGNK